MNSSSILEVRSPNDGRLIETLSKLSSNELTHCLNGFHAKKVSPWRSRVQALRAVANEIRSTSDEWAQLIALEGGKPLVDARIEATRAARTLDLSADEAERGNRDAFFGSVPMPAGKRASSFFEPLGPVFSITAFNHPLNLVAHHLGPAIAAGCPLFNKPALETPLSAIKLTRLFQKYLPNDPIECAVIETDHASALVADPRWAGIAFIGSAKVGWQIRRQCADGVRVALEHGGSAPMIVMPSANVEKAVKTAVKHGFYHSGQVCISLQRLFVHASILDEFRARFLEAVRKLKVGDARLPTTDCGPLIRERDVERVHQWIHEAVKKGAKLHCGGDRVSGLDSSLYYSPTVLENVPSGAMLSSEEAFGPIVQLESIQSLSEAIEKANSTRWAFHSSIFSNDSNEIEIARLELKASTVLVNEGPAFRVDDMPFRGDGPSGLETGGVPYAYRWFAKEKLLIESET